MAPFSAASGNKNNKAWMAGTSQNKSGHDEGWDCCRGVACLHRAFAMPTNRLPVALVIIPCEIRRDDFGLGNHRDDLQPADRAAA